MGLLLLQGASDLNPRELFANNEQGLWLDPSQMSTLYQDSNGVTPCTAAGDPVGLILDQSRGGLGALGTELVTNGGFADATGWSSPIAGSSITGGALVFDGVTSIANAAVATEFQNAEIIAGRFYRVVYTINSGTTNAISMRVGGTVTPLQTNAGTYSCFVSAVDTTKPAIVTRGGSGIRTGSVDNISVREVPGNHAYQTTSAARPTLQTSGGLWYLSFDGSDDSLLTNAVDFSGTDEMTVIAGVRKLSDGARGTVCELTATIASNNGAFHLTAPNAASDTFAFESKGTALTDAVATGIASPASRVLAGLADISGDSAILRINGTQSDADTGDQGTGNYSNAVIYIGRRASSSLPYNGHLYQLIIRGKTTPTGKLLEAERFTARKTGVTGI